MSTITTRSLGKEDAFDRRAVRVNAADYEEKSGIFEITLSNYIVTGSPVGGNVDVRVPNYNPVNDTPVLDEEEVSVAGTNSLSNKIYVAVNNGVPGPSARINPDSTWDLLDLTYTLPDDNTFENVSVTLTYSVAFTDLTPSTTNPSSGNASLTLEVSENSHSDDAVIGIASGTLGSSNGYIKAWINSITSTITRGVTDPAITFAVTHEASNCGCVATDADTLIRHQLAPVSGTKVYTQAMFVFAVNLGKIDGNGNPIKGTNTQSVALNCKLDSAFDTASVSVSYNVAFTAV